MKIKQWKNIEKEKVFHEKLKHEQNEKKKKWKNEIKEIKELKTLNVWINEKRKKKGRKIN